VILENIFIPSTDHCHAIVKRLSAGIVVVVCALTFVFANCAAAQTPARLQTLLNDTVAQLQLAYRHNVPEQRRRYDELAQVVAAWREAPRNDANNRLLEDWLRAVIRSSMPGSQESLPPAPQFARPSVLNERAPVVQPDTMPVEPIAQPDVEHSDKPPRTGELESSDAAFNKSIGDPFGDDPPG
jgi:hypothetical protein